MGKGPQVVDNLPRPQSPAIAVRVQPEAERAVRQGHPWLFEQAIIRQSRPGAPGDPAVIFDRKNRFLAVGLYDPLSPIRVRVLQHGAPAKLDEALFAARISDAVALRRPLLDPSRPRTSGYRVVHGENDRLPGLVVDRYEETLVIKLYTGAWIPHLPALLAVLKAQLSPLRIILRLSRNLQRETEYLYGLEDGLILFGEDLVGPLIFIENGLRFEADPLRGQKTGFFLDQRENRARVEGYASGSVLNLFAYSGGFSLYAARGGAADVLSVDISQGALEGARRNFALNTEQLPPDSFEHRIWAEDVFVALDSLREEGRLFDLVVIDPPAFARTGAQSDRAQAAYARLTRKGLSVLKMGGILVQASCSTRVDADTFFARIEAAAHAVGRPLQVLERSGHPLDHPIGFPEGAYLKALFARA